VFDRKSLWALSAFIYYEDENIHSYIPGWGLHNDADTINMTSLRAEVKLLNLQSAHGQLEVLDITGEGLRHHENSLSVLVKNVIKTVDIHNMSQALASYWKELFPGMHLTI